MCVDLLCSGSFRGARGNLVDKTGKAMFPLLSAITNFHLPCSKSIQLFDLLIKPIALYNSENWATLTHHKATSLEQNKTTLITYMTSPKVHLGFLKFILGLKRNCLNSAALGEVGQFPLIQHGFVHLLTYWQRLTNLSDLTSAEQAFNIQMERNIAQSEWAATAKYLLSQIGMNNHLSDPLLANTNDFSKMCTTKLRKRFTSQWHSQINGSSLGLDSNKLRFYKQFKSSFQMEPYLNLIHNFQLRKCISKFRCNDHVLEIETRRHQNSKVEERICKICKEAVETEEHFLRFCPKYSELRYRNFGNISSFVGCVRIHKCEDKKSAFNLANLLGKSFKTRKRAIINI